MNKKAPRGKVWVCIACGKMSKDQYGDEAISYGWDISCVINSYIFNKKDLVIVDGRVISTNAKVEKYKKDFKGMVNEKKI